MAYRGINRREFLASSGAVAAVSVLTPQASHAASSRDQVTHLRTEYLDQPIGVESRNPRLSWQIESARRNVRQLAYRIFVASTEEMLRSGRADLWDSGKVQSAKSNQIPYEGLPLLSRQQCYWRVHLWLRDSDQHALVSETSWWEMGLVNDHDWTAKWLAAESQISRDDRAEGLQWIWGAQDEAKVTRAFRLKFRLPTDAGGYFYAATNDFLIWTQIARIYIDGVAIAGRGDWLVADGMGEADSLQGNLEQLSAGDHQLAIEVLAAPALSEVESTLKRGLTFFFRAKLADGTLMRIGKSGEWKALVNPPPGWQRAKYDDSRWPSAVVVQIAYQPWPPLPAVQLRRAFKLPNDIVQARLYATACGAYEARINGKRVGDRLLTPEISQYDKRVLYQVYDVTAMLSHGANVIGLIVGDGWYASFDGYYAWAPAPRRALVQLEVTLADGSHQVVATGPGWSLAESPIRVAQMKVGETYDARLERSGWDSPGFDDSGWNAAELADAPSTQLTAQIAAPVRVVETLKPQSIRHLGAQMYVVDFGRNFAGWCRLVVRGAAGTRVEMRFAELIGPAGTIEQPYMNIGLPKTDVFILKGGDGPEVFEPHFCYRGFRYVQVSGLPTRLSEDAIQGIGVSSDYAATGLLRADHSAIEEIWRNIRRTQQSNMVGSVTDCCSREQRSHQATSALIWDDATFNWDLAAYTARYLDNLRDAQHPSGAMPHVAPEPRNNNALFLPESWPEIYDAVIVLPWITWWRYGDTAIIEKNWDAMNRYLDWSLARHPDYIWRMHTAWPGDWLSLREMQANSAIPTAPIELTGTARWAHALSMLAEMGDAIGRSNDAMRLRSTLQQVREAFIREFVSADGTVGNGAQTNYVLALQFDLLPSDLRSRAAENLASDIRARGVSLTTGTTGTRFLLDVLKDCGYSDLAFGLLLRTEFPSWGYEIERGATTVWESWSGEQQWIDQDTKELKSIKLSQNHAELATISGWLFRNVAGIDAIAPGFSEVRIRPVLDSRVKRGGGDFDSIMGRISTDWIQYKAGAFSMSVTLPANTSGVVHLPARSSAVIREGHLSVSKRKDIKVVTRSELEVVLAVASGSYRFWVDA